jgi:hypothetical protein
MRDHRDLVIPAGDGEDATNLGVGESRIDVSGTRGRCRCDLTRGGVLNRYQCRHFGESTHRLLMHLGKRTSGGKRR